MLNTSGAKFITSAAGKQQFIVPDKPMIAVCGKSNVGKSSFINMLADHKGLAKTSADPGRTRLVNYFDFGAFILADLPGYGYAKVSKEEKARWAATLDEFFAKKEDIAHVFVLADIRHEPTENDVNMVHYLNYHIIPFTVITTKADKLSKMKVKESVRKVAAGFNIGEGNIIATSALSKIGRAETLDKVEKIISVYNEQRKI